MPVYYAMFTITFITLVENTNLQLKISQLEEQAERTSQIQLADHNKAIRNKEEEQKNLVEQLSQVMQEKQALADQVSQRNFAS